MLQPHDFLLTQISSRKNHYACLCIYFPFASVQNQWAALALLAVLTFASYSAQAQSLAMKAPPASLLRRWRTPSLPGQGFGACRRLSLYRRRNGLGDYQTASVTEGFYKRFEFGYTANFMPLISITVGFQANARALKSFTARRT